MLWGALSCQIRKSDYLAGGITGEPPWRETGPETTWRETEGRITLAESLAPGQQAKWNQSRSGPHTVRPAELPRTAPCTVQNRMVIFQNTAFCNTFLEKTETECLSTFKSVPSFDKYKIHTLTWRFICSPVFYTHYSTLVLDLIIRYQYTKF